MNLTWRTAARLHGPTLTALLDEETDRLFEPSESGLLDSIDPGCAVVVILLPWRPPPLDDMRDDGTVHSFLCSASVLDRLLSLYPAAALDRVCFLLLHGILNGEIAVDRLLIRQLPCHTPEPIPFPARIPAAVLMAHRGRSDHLQVALSYLPRSHDSGLRIRVGLDIDEIADHRETLRRFRDVEFYQAPRAPVGPYVIRQQLADRSGEDLLVFHDSDDVSCQDRVPRLYAELRRTGCDLVGSHECRVDEIDEEVRAFRFPLDATEALRAGPAHALLHPASMISRDAFRSAGGFSTDQIIGCDTQFLLRAYFQLRIRNADSFLYVRRRHADALTVAPGTGLGSPLRRSIENPWRADFESVKSGRIGIQESTLRCRSAAQFHDLIPLSPS